MTKLTMNTSTKTNNGQKDFRVKSISTVKIIMYVSNIYFLNVHLFLCFDHQLIIRPYNSE